MSKMASRVAKQGHRYMGETKNQLRNGYGIYQYPNSFFRYEGDWKEGKKHGHGKLVMGDGSYYEGEFINGEIEGHGYRKWATSGNTYSGQFGNGELNGRGVMTYTDGSVYEGEFLANRREGRGVLKDVDGAVYEGSFHDNLKHGEGSQNYCNGDQYVGDWIKGKRQGSGELACLDGTVYDGQWRNDLFNGEGTITHSSGMTYDGLWVNGHPAVEAAHIVISDAELDLVQGVPFDVEIEIRSSDGTLVEEDQNRELQITAGFRHYTPNQDSPFFDLIEEMEEKPIPTPYGYDVVPYPLTEFSTVERAEQSAISPLRTNKPPTSLGDAAESTSQEEMPPTAVSVSAKTASTDTRSTYGSVSNRTSEGTAVVKGEDVAASKNEMNRSTTDASQATGVQGTDEATTQVVTTESAVAGNRSNGSTDELHADSPVPPSVNNTRTDGGKITFKNIVLPGVPDGSQPYTPSPVRSMHSAKSAISVQGGVKEGGGAGKKNRGKTKTKLTKQAEGDDLFLSQTPPSYRPFTILDLMIEEEVRTRATGQLGHGAKVGRTVAALTSSDADSPGLSFVDLAQRLRSEISTEDEPNYKEEADELADQISLKEKDSKASKAKREKLYGDERFARPAEYVIMVKDVTNPPFLSKTLPPAFMLVKIAHPKKFKKAKTPTKGSKPSSRASSHND